MKYSQHPNSLKIIPINSLLISLKVIVDVWQKKYTQFQHPSYSTYRTEIGVDPKTARKYLSVGAQAGLD
jgi:hypothetical protein